MDKASFDTFMNERENNRRESENIAPSPLPVSEQRSGIDKAAFSSFMTQKAKADTWNDTSEKISAWGRDADAFGQKVAAETQDWKATGNAAIIGQKISEEGKKLAKRGAEISDFFRNYGDEYDASEGAGASQKVIDAIGEDQAKLRQASDYYGYIAKGWSRADNADDYRRYTQWDATPERSSADVMREIEELSPRVKGFYDYALKDSPTLSDADYERLAKQKDELSTQLDELRKEYAYRNQNEKALALATKQAEWKKNRRGTDVISLNLDTVTGNIKDLEREEGRLAGILNDLESGRDLPEFDAANYEAVKRQHDDIERKLKDLEPVQQELSEELEYSKKLDWEELRNNPDFAEKRKYTPTDINLGNLDLSLLISSDKELDALYGAINRESAAWARYATAKMPGEILKGHMPSGGLELAYITQDERDIFNYLYATDKEKAREYFNELQPQLTARQRQGVEQYLHDWTQESGWNAALGSVATVLTSPLKAASYFGQAADYLTTGKIDQNALYNAPSYWNNAVRGAVTENWDKVGTFAYQTGMSMADFLWNALITGGLSGAGAVAENLSLAIMGASAAADTVIEQKDRGMDDARAFTLGTVAGLAEIVTEKVSLEALLKPDLSKGAFSYLIKNVLAEGSEEGASDLINYFADDLYDLISGQEASKWREAINNYRAQGYTESEAFGRALADRAGEVGLDMLGGALSGGVMAGGSLAINAYQNGKAQQNAQRSAESAPNASEGNYTTESANTALAKADEVSTGNAALDETLRAISEAGTVTNAQARTIIADRTMLDALSEITGIDLSSVGQPTSSMTASEQRMAVKGAAIQAAETLNEQNNAALQTETVDNAAIANPAQSVVAPAVSPESSVGAATRGFVDNPNPGKMVPSQNKSVTTNPFLTDDEKLEYNPAHERISTAEQNRRADNMFVSYDDAGTIRNWDEVAADLMSKKAWTAVEQKAAQKIFEQYRKEARVTGDYEKLNAFAKAMADIGRSEAGASLQALKEFSHNGDGLVQQSIEILDNPKIDEDIRDAETKRILDASEKFDNAEVLNEKGEVDKAATMKNFADLVLEVAEARNNIKDRNDVRKTITWALDTVMKTGDVDFMRDLAWGSLVASIQDNIPIPASEAIKSLRRDFMLSKISTAMRNIVSNMAFDLIDGISRNISVPLDILVSKFTGTRSIAKTDIISKAKMKAQVDAFAKSFLEVAFNVSAEGAASGYGAAGNRTFRMSGGPVEQVLSRMEQYLNLAMYSTDQFQKGGIRESVQSGIDELYEKGLIKDESLRDAGDIEMLYRTFQKDGALATALKGIRDTLNNLSSTIIPGSFQLGDIIMPFVQVPANLVSAAVDYTPLGILKEAAKLYKASKSGKLTAAHQARMVQAVGRSFNGSAVIALAAIAKAIGALTVSDDGRDRDKDKTALDTQAGLSGTQLNLSALIRAFSGEDTTRQDGDLLVNIGFMDPLNALLTIGSLIHDEVTDEDGYKFGDLAGKSVAGTLQSVKDMPMMGAIDELYSAINNSAEEDWGARALDAGVRYAANQVSSFVPNVLKGIAQGTDPYQRDLYSKDDVFGRAFDSVLASIPGLRETLPVKQDSFGEDMDTGNWWLNFLNNNILPGRVNQYSPRQEGIKTVLDATSDATGEVNFYPDRYAPKTIDGHKLTYKEKRAYKKAYGDAFKEAMSETGDMSDLTIEEVTDILTNINSYARGTAKEAVSDGYTYKPSNNSYVRGLEALDSVGIPIADYYTYYKDISNIKKKYDTTDERKKRVIEYINEHKTLSTEQKNYLWHETAHFDSRSPWEST